MPRGRPGRSGFKKVIMAFEVLELKKVKGWTKLNSAVDEIARKRGITPRTVWNYLTGFDAAAFEHKRKDVRVYNVVDSAAVDYLTETEGATRQFTDEEIRDAKEILCVKGMEAFHGGDY